MQVSTFRMTKKEPKKDRVELFVLDRFAVMVRGDIESLLKNAVASKESNLEVALRHLCSTWLYQHLLTRCGGLIWGTNGNEALENSFCSLKSKLIRYRHVQYQEEARDAISGYIVK